jgi:hypothetical protein
MDRKERQVGKIGRIDRFFSVAVNDGGGPHNCAAAL